MAGWSDAEFDVFVGARMGALVRFAYTLTGDVGHAEDLVQTALMRVYGRSPDNPEQYKRFLETAREVGADQPGEAFDRVLDKVARQAPERPKRDKKG